MREDAFPIVACVAWILAAALAVSPIHTRLSLGISAEDAGNADPLMRSIGSFKEAVGDLAFLKADSYYHGGARHAEHDEEGDHDEIVEVSAPTDWVSYVAAKIRPTADRHAKGAELAELTPLLAAATQLDPHHVAAILTTAFWLNSNLNRTDDAIEVLEEGIRNNPASWQLDAVMGDIYLEKRNDPVLASDFLASAAHKLTAAPDAERFERRKVWLLLADAYDRSGQVKKALTAYRKALSLFEPADPAAARAKILSKISQLETSTLN